MKATIDGGFWAGRRRFNRDVLIPDGERQIREAGTFDNLRAAATGSGTHRGLVYQDSDLHKWVEALGWELRNAPSPALQRMADEVTALLSRRRRRTATSTPPSRSRATSATATSPTSTRSTAWAT